MAAIQMYASSIPTDKVVEMRAQGLSNNQIIQILQRDGYSLPAVFNAMNQADIKGGVDASGLAAPLPADALQQPDTGGSMMPQPNQMMQQMQNQQQPQYGDQVPMMQDTGMMTDQGLDPNMQQPMDTGTQMPPDYGQQGYGPAPAPMGSYGGPSFESQRIEELAEAIIDEKWNEIVRSINKIIDWKERVEARVTKMEQQLDDMNKNFDTLHKGVLGKITDYDRNLTNVGAEIKAMDKVFQKVLPSLTENVSELSRITAGMRKK
ncbi:MAG: hypothetical protein HY832_02550 [Candidatus Aenigmarchaeota archaeon]|nr:hypothetical protein [Candidatus Aenigmarchaeota archaeon]